MNELRRIVTFRCPAFNATEEKEKFINPNNYGDDVAEWFAAELEKMALLGLWGDLSLIKNGVEG
jgi:hypothetical protein